MTELSAKYGTTLNISIGTTYHGKDFVGIINSRGKQYLKEYMEHIYITF